MENRLPLRISLGLIVAVLAAYLPVLHADFVNFDDSQYVYFNSHVKTGLTRDNIAWAWTSFEAANWHPLTWMSHQLDCQLFGLQPGSHHFVNLCWHITNTVALFLVLRRMTGEDWRPALVAALFGLHPLHVESVAWVSERKDVTSTFFALVTLGLYTLYAARPSVGRYLAILASFTLGLLCKPMLVTWPFVLLLMDYWPLRRFAHTPASRLRLSALSLSRKRLVGRLVLEKLPLLALAVGSCLITMRAQVGAMKASEHLSFGFRLANALVSYATYLRKMVWPMDLAAFYRHQGTRLPLTPAIVSGVVLVLLSLAALLSYRRRPALLVGWLWYLGTLVPVIGLVQVGVQSMADRYTYIPLIGIFLALAWSIPPAAREIRKPKAESRDQPRRFGFRLSDFGFPALAGAILTICAVLTFRQAQYWNSAEELWARAVKVAENPVSYCFYARALYGKGLEMYTGADELQRKGRTAEAERLVAQGKDRIAAAELQCRLALQMEPSFALARAQLEEYQVLRNDLEGAWATLSEAVALEPQSAGLHDLLGRVLAYMGRIEEACREFREACRLESESGVRHFDLGTALALLGDCEEAQREWELGRQLEPDFSEDMRKFVDGFLENSYRRRHCPSAAVFHAQELCWSTPTPQADFYQRLAQAYAQAGRPVAAYLAAQRALTLAETNGLADLLPALRQLVRSYEPLAHQYEARAAAAAVAAPALPLLPGILSALAVLEADRNMPCLSGAFANNRAAR
jgi:tetratricopeptide (TPR) repeat protein